MRSASGQSAWALVHAARATVVVLGGCTALLLDEGGTAGPLWLPLAALVVVTAAVERRRPIPARWAVDLVAVMAVRAWVDVHHGTEPLFALIGATVAAGALGGGVGVLAAIATAGASFALAVPAGWDDPWRELASSLAVVALLALAGHVIGIVDRRSREAGRRAQEHSQRLQAVLSAMLRSDPRGIIVRDGAGQVVEINESARQLLGLGTGDVVGGPDSPAAAGELAGLRTAIVDRDGHPLPAEDLPSEVALRTGHVAPERVIGLGPDPARWLAVSAVPVDTAEGRWVLTQLRDVTAETSTVVRLRHEAALDPLTGVGNRRLLDWTVEDLIDPDERVGVVLVDLDDFKAVNDAHGHAVGDQVLRQIAERLQAVCRPDDVAVRLGGDEFVIVLRRLDDVAGAAQIVDRLDRALQAPFVTEAGLLAVSCSLGWTTGSATDAQRLVREADRQMYASKPAAPLAEPIDIRGEVRQAPGG